jgi:hypothetical protein
VATGSAGAVTVIGSAVNGGGIFGTNTSGNLHLDADPQKRDGLIVLGAYSGRGVAFGNGAGGPLVAQVDTAGNFTKLSDGRLKDDVTELHGVLDKIDRVRGVSYRWKNAPSHAAAAGQRDIGVIAQEVGAVFPDIVKPLGPGPSAYQGVDYNKLTAVLVEAVKELHAENRALQRRLETVERRRR